MSATPACPRCTSIYTVFVLALQNTDRYRCVRCKAQFTYRELPMTPPEPTRDLFVVREHQSKEAAYVTALLQAGYAKSLPRTGVKFFLADYDVLGVHEQMQRMADRYKVPHLFVYPHSGRPSVINDLYNASQYTTAQFVPAQGHVDVFRSYGYKKPIHVVGWHLSDVIPYKPRKLKNVLFAPIHPKMSTVDKGLNKAVHDILIGIAKQTGLPITVRMMGDFLSNGFEPSEHIAYTRSSDDPSYEQVKRASVVIAHQTIAYISVALGVPTVMMGEDVPPHNFNGKTQAITYVKSWSKYRDAMMFPLDILNTTSPLDLLVSACQTDEPIQEWRGRMIGQSFSAELFIEQITKYQ